jgi:subtilisin family serine protease
MKRTALTAAVSFALAFAMALPVFAEKISPKYAAYLETLGENDYASAFIFLVDRPDIGALDRELHAQGAPMSVRHERVITALQEAAERSQPALLDYLDTRVEAGAVKGYTPYWLTNMVIVSATRAELEAIAQRGDVEAIEPNFRAVLIEEVDRPYMGTGTAGIGVTKSLKAINADRVWKELGITGDGTLVANMDTGVDGYHDALQNRWRGNWHPWWECWRDALGSTQFPNDGWGHGTHVMGTMCGAGHATGDTVGVAFDALWIADNSINQSVGPEFDNDVLEGYQWFADPDGDPGTTDDVPDVLQNSWGIDSRFGYDYEDCDYRWQEVIENCEAAGVVVTYSAGNEGPGSQTHRSPANICNTPTVNFSVGAVDAENSGWPYPIANWSSRGPSDCDGTTIKPEVCAPGVDVYSCWPGDSYYRLDGTSMAGPHVAGVVALMRQANPNADVQTIKEVLMATARDLGSTGEDNTYGWGFIDAYEAVLGIMGGVYVTLDPDATTVRQGGRLGYDVEVGNKSDESKTLEYWSDVYLWTGEPYCKNPVFGPMLGTLGAGQVKTGHISHKIPSNAPLRTYSLCGRIGFHPYDIWDEDCFQFTVIAGSSGLEPDGADWEVIESTF